MLNETDNVRIEAQGDGEDLERFLHLLRTDQHPLSRVDEIEVLEIERPPSVESDFQIRASTSAAAPQPSIPAEAADQALQIMRTDPAATEPAVIGSVVATHGGVVEIRGELGAGRILDLLSGEQMPRIC